MGNVDVASMKSGEYHFFSIACWPFTYGILYTVELVLYWICLPVIFLQFCLSFHFHVCGLVFR